MQGGEFMSIIEKLDSNLRQHQSTYKMVTFLSMLDCALPKGEAHINIVTDYFKKFYRIRMDNGKLPEAEDKKMAKVKYLKEIEIKSLLLENPIPRLIDFIEYNKETKLLKFKDQVLREINRETEAYLRRLVFKHLYQYYKNLDTYQITLEDLGNLPQEYAVSAKDVSMVSNQSVMKGIHPITKDDFKGVIILCTIGGEQYPNEWLDEEKTILKYYLEGRTNPESQRKVYNLNITTNKSIIDSKEEGYPIHVFIREKKGELFHYSGEFLYQQVVEESSGDKYFELIRKGKKTMAIPEVDRDKIIEALNEFDDSLRNTIDWQGWEERSYQKYAILFEEKLYPPKKIISMATGTSVKEFSGGYQTNSYLEKRGFEIITLDEGNGDDGILVDDPKVVVKQIIDFIDSKGFVYPSNFIKNFFLCLKTKPFIILAGISGTGKSKLVELFAESVGATNQNGRFKLIPVRPDWNDSTDLLGYKNLQGEFLEGQLTKVIKDANENPEYPYFVCLDEMNLARVEYYFSDFLSIIESRRINEGQIVSSYLDICGKKLDFPENLYVIGTVNMDETTHSFSRKVLDRANTIEFSEVNLSKFPGQANQVLNPSNLKNEVLKSEYITLRDCFSGNEDYITEKVKILEELNEILGPNGFHVGYRVRDELSFYLLYNRRWQLLPEEVAVDFQIMQKILPRIHGSAMEIETILNELKSYCGDKYPMSSTKIDFMLRRFTGDGFTSFWA